jgi:hypothetical protein
MGMLAGMSAMSQQTAANVMMQPALPGQQLMHPQG